VVQSAVAEPVMMPWNVDRRNAQSAAGVDDSRREHVNQQSVIDAEDFSFD
jgi:hypothetical protein